MIRTLDDTKPAPAEPAIRYVHNPEFERPDAVETILRTSARIETDPPAGQPPPNLPEDTSPYIRDLYRTPLLTRQQERDLFRRYNCLKFAAEKNRRAGRIDLMQSLLRQATAAKDRIVTANLRLIVHFAAKTMHLSYNRLTLEELTSDGNLLLVRAVEGFDYDRGLRFSTYLTWGLIRQLRRAAGREGGHHARFRSGQDEQVLDNLSALQSHEPDDIKSLDLRDSLDAALGRLSARERTIVSKHYGLANGEKPLTLREIGGEMDLHKETVRHIEQRAMEKLRDLLRAQNVPPAVKEAVTLARQKLGALIAQQKKETQAAAAAAERDRLRQRQERLHRAGRRLAAQERTEIRRLWREGKLSRKQLAAQFGVWERTISTYVGDYRRTAYKLTARKVQEIRHLSASGMSAQRVATRYGVSRQTVVSVVERRTWRHVRDDQGPDDPALPEPLKKVVTKPTAAACLAGKPKLSPEEYDDIRHLYAKGDVSQAELAEKFGISETTARYHIEKGRKGLPYRGDRHKLAKLTSAKVREMRRRHAAGASISQLARDYGMSVGSVSPALKGQTWRHISYEPTVRELENANAASVMDTGADEHNPDEERIHEHVESCIC